jgi:F-type H+-transporting ATPase subunit gamma
MQRLSELKSRIHNLAELGNVVSALRAVSAARVQQAHAVLESIRKYTAIIQEALEEASRALPGPYSPANAPPSAGFVIAFGSEHGFVGAFNEHVLDVAAAHCKPADELFVVGSRAHFVAGERHVFSTWTCQSASQVSGVDEVALRLAERLSLAGARQRVDRISLVYTQITDDSAARVVTETLLPFDAHPYLAKPGKQSRALSNLSPLLLLDGLVDELLFAQLAKASIESFASENAARLATMQAATDNVAAKLDDLAKLEHELRQEEITTELLDVVTGAEAVAERHRRRSSPAW